MRKVLDVLDPFFAAAAIAIAGLTVMSQVPYPLIPVSLPDINLAIITEQSSLDID